ncbi:MAG TPA: hypothetical protein VLT36_11870 [Candidatus Dormibacteraeota bacterium]|nr:hypothetical protein [Candidatus Dormibacteraeota bacterium]
MVLEIKGSVTQQSSCCKRDGFGFTGQVLPKQFMSRAVYVHMAIGNGQYVNDHSY